MTATEKRSLHSKLAQVMYEAERIPKNGVAPAAMGGFRFVQVGDAADAIRKALAEQKISMIPTAIEIVGEAEHPTSSGKVMTTLTVRTTWTLTDGDSGETIVIQSLGAGADTGDKAAPKAQSNAMKYALLMGFLLSTGDDPEQTDTSDRQTRPAPPRLPPREDPNVNEPPAPPAGEPYAETEEIIGRKRQRGIIRKGGKDSPAIYQLNATPHPEGRTVGFRLETTKGSIPQCLVEGALGELLVTAMGENLAALAGTPATVSGVLYYVKTNRDHSWYRLHVDRIETKINGLEVILPADEVLPEPPDNVELPGEAPSEPLGLVS